MDRYLGNNNQAIVILHEIYGINDFIKDQCKQYFKAGFDVFCTDMVHKRNFPYNKPLEAYLYFMNKVGFEISAEINGIINKLKKQYEKVFVLGFSVGATVAWKCCENPLCDGIICCYGSRIRDYTYLNPVCPTLLLFAKYDSFDVDSLIVELENKLNNNFYIVKFAARHGFMDFYSQHYEDKQDNKAQNYIMRFIKKYIR